MAYRIAAFERIESVPALRWVVGDGEGRQWGWGSTEAEAWAHAERRIAELEQYYGKGSLLGAVQDAMRREAEDGLED